MSRNRIAVLLATASFVLGSVNPSYAVIRWLKELSGPGGFLGLDVLYTISIADLQFSGQDLEGLSEEDRETLRRLFDARIPRVPKPLHLRADRAAGSDTLDSLEQIEYVRELAARFSLDAPTVLYLQAILYLIHSSPGITAEGASSAGILASIAPQFFSSQTIALQRARLFTEDQGVRNFLVQQLRVQTEAFRKVGGERLNAEILAFLRANDVELALVGRVPGSVDDLLTLLGQPGTSMELIHIVTYQSANIALRHDVNDHDLFRVRKKLSGLRGALFFGAKSPYPMLRSVERTSSKRRNPWFDLGVGIQYSFNNELPYAEGFNRSRNVWWLSFYGAAEYRKYVGKDVSLFVNGGWALHRFLGDGFDDFTKTGPQLRFGAKFAPVYIGVEFNWFVDGFDAVEFGAVPQVLTGDQPNWGLFVGLDLAHLIGAQE